MINLFDAKFFALISYFFLGIKNVETFFGTAPVVWNRLFTAMANLVPKEALRDRSLMSKFALFSLPMVRLVDMLVGSTNGTYVHINSVIIT